MNDKQIEILKKRIQLGYILPLLLLLIGLSVDVYLILTNLVNISLTLLINISILILIIIILYFNNWNLYKDLRKKELLLEYRQVLKKEDIRDYEVGSAALYIPILGDLFPKLWGPKMNEFSKYKIAFLDKYIFVDKEMYESLDNSDEVTLYYAKYSKTFLGMKKIYANCEVK